MFGDIEELRVHHSTIRSGTAKGQQALNGLVIHSATDKAFAVVRLHWIERHVKSTVEIPSWLEEAGALLERPMEAKVGARWICDCLS